MIWRLWVFQDLNTKTFSEASASSALICSRDFGRQSEENACTIFGLWPQVPGATGVFWTKPMLWDFVSLVKSCQTLIWLRRLNVGVERLSQHLLWTLFELLQPWSFATLAIKLWRFLYVYLTTARPKGCTRAVFMTFESNTRQAPR